MTSRDQDEMAVFLVGVLKRFLYAFDQLDAVSEIVEPGGTVMAFYLDAVYNYCAQLFLLDRKGKPMGGSAYVALSEYGLESLLDPIHELLDEPIGSTSFGEAMRVFRNTALVHASHGDGDLDGIYALVNMSAQQNQVRWQALLWQLRDAVRDLALSIAGSTDRPLKDFGF